MAVLAAGLTFFLVSISVWEFLSPWRRWGAAALWPWPARKWMHHASKVESTGQSVQGGGAWSIVSNGRQTTWKYVIGADGRIQFYSE